MIAGFLQGFLLFLAIPVDWSLPFGGLPVFGAVAALALWLYLIHVLVLVGYRLTLTLDAHWRPGLVTVPSSGYFFFAGSGGSATVSAASARRSPIGRGGPVVVSCFVCFSDSALISAPSRMM